MIEVKFDNALNLPPIEENMYNNSPEEDGTMGQENEMQQTKVTGIVSPLIKVNNVVCHFSQVKYMVLKDEFLPEIDLIINDQMGIMQSINQPTSDNSLQIQIIPPFDDAYKKINLTFYMDSVQIHNDGIHIHGIYNIPKIQDTVMKAYGKTTTYKFFEEAAHDLNLGFCSNIADTDDERYIYIPNKKYTDIFEQEIKYGGSQTCLLDCWVDLWNNLNLVDVYSQYNTIEKEEDMQIWVSDSRFLSTEPTTENKPSLMLACLTNNPRMTTNQLYTKKHTYINTPTLATDRVFEVYDMDKLESASTLIQDGDVKNDIFVQYEYGGEKFGEHDYLTQEACRGLFMSKIDGQRLKLSIQFPTLALMKGHKVNVYWYDLNPYTDAVKDVVEIQSNITLPEDDILEGDNKYRINKQVSGQYYIINTTFRYSQKGNNYQWEQEFELGRPLSGIQNYETE